MGPGESSPMDLGEAKRSRSPSAASPAAFWVISLVPPGEAQRSGFAGKRRSKGTSAVFATRRKRSRVDFATTSRRGQSRSPPGRRNLPARNETALLSPPHPPQCEHWGTFPYPLCRFATSPLDKGSRPPRGRLLRGASSSVWPSASHLPPRGKALRGRPPGHLSPMGRLIKNETGAPGRPFSRGRLIALIGDTSCWSDTGARR